VRRCSAGRRSHGSAGERLSGRHQATRSPVALGSRAAANRGASGGLAGLGPSRGWRNGERHRRTGRELHGLAVVVELERRPIEQPPPGEARAAPCRAPPARRRRRVATLPVGFQAQGLQPGSAGRSRHGHGCRRLRAVSASFARGGGRVRASSSTVLATPEGSNSHQRSASEPTRVLPAEKVRAGRCGHEAGGICARRPRLCVVRRSQFRERTRCPFSTRG
jgi:hypothetical protein